MYRDIYMYFFAKGTLSEVKLFTGNSFAFERKKKSIKTCSSNIHDYIGSKKCCIININIKLAPQPKAPLPQTI